MGLGMTRKTAAQVDWIWPSSEHGRNLAELGGYGGVIGVEWSAIAAAILDGDRTDYAVRLRGQV